jgi:hypothetical protein
VGASPHDTVPTSTGVTIAGSVLPKLIVLPAVTQIGVNAPPRPGPDRMQGFDVAGKPIFDHPFADDGYSFSAFIPLHQSEIDRLERVRVTIAGKTVTVHAAPPAPAAATARALDGGRVEVSWNAHNFPRLWCVGEEGGSPAPLMLNGTFVAANIRGRALTCDFSDGLKTVHAKVRVPIRGR